MSRIRLLLLLTSWYAATVHANHDSIMKPLISFNQVANEPEWRAINDGVMGGRSLGRAEVRDGLLYFTGRLSLANNGGFASVRTVGQTLDLSKVLALVLRVRGDGRRYQLRLATPAQFRGIAVSYGYSFQTEPDTWIDVRVPLTDLRPSVRGLALLGPPLDPATVTELGLLIADKQEGAFRLELDWIQTLPMEPSQ